MATAKKTSKPTSKKTYRMVIFEVGKEPREIDAEGFWPHMLGDGATRTGLTLVHLDPLRVAYRTSTKVPRWRVLDMFGDEVLMPGTCIALAKNDPPKGKLRSLTRKEVAEIKTLVTPLVKAIKTAKTAKKVLWIDRVMGALAHLGEATAHEVHLYLIEKGDTTAFSTSSGSAVSKLARDGIIVPTGRRRPPKNLANDRGTWFGNETHQVYRPVQDFLDVFAKEYPELCPPPKKATKKK